MSAILPSAALTEAAADNLVAHFTFVQRHAPGMRVLDTPGLVLTDGGLPCDTFNAAMRARLDEASAHARIREALAWFAERGHPFSWWVGPGDGPLTLGRQIEAAGLERRESELAMVADLDALPATASPPELRIRRVATPGELEAFARINAENWSPPDPMVEQFYARAQDALLGPEAPLRLYVGCLGAEPVATAELAIGGGVVGLYGISTRAAHRRRGYGTALTAHPLREARAAGFRTAILQAAADGVGVYRRLGFQTFGEFVEYKP